MAQQAPAAAPELERVEITGSSIKRIEAETALPVQVITRKDIEATGAQTVEQLLQTISAVSGSGSMITSSASGATTGGVSGVSLRGLSTYRTLVLVNGRRIAPYGLGFSNDSVTVDVNSIPLAMVERVEVLKDGASAVYGSDAIAGVVNFILRKDYKGAELEAYYGDARSNPYISRLTGSYGYGDMATNKFNVMAMVNVQHENPLFGRDRAFANSVVNVGAGNDVTSGNTFPGNFVPFDPATGTQLAGTHNPGAPNNCAPSISDPNTSFFSPHGCRFDYGRYVSLIEKTDRLAFLGTGRLALTSNVEAYAEASFTHNQMNTVIQPVPLSDQFAIPSTNVLANQEPYNGFLNGVALPVNTAPASTIVMTPSSPYYPTAYVNSLGITTAAGGLPDLLVRYRNFATGLRDLTDTSQAPRLVLGTKGTAMNWDFDASLLYSGSQVTEHVNGGFPAYSKLLPLLNSGQVNLFGPNTAAINQQLQATNFIGDAFVDSTSMTSFQAKATRDLMQLPAGPMAFAAGVEERHEDYKVDPSPVIQTGDISGYGGNFLPVDKGRNVTGVFAELDVPILRTLDADFALRHDQYQVSGGATVPKIAARWQPVKQILIRGSLSEGFRAPGLGDLYAPQTQTVTPGLSDPVRCPITHLSQDCATQYTNIQGGNPALTPERSQNRTFGFVFEPIAGASLAVDFFKITLSHAIGTVAPATIVDNQSIYASLITRGPVSAGFPNLPGPITSIDSISINSPGLTKISGVDFDGKWSINLVEAGKLNLSFSGTYMSRFDSQNLDGSWSSAIDQTASAFDAFGGVINRWKYFATVNWVDGPWSTTVTQLHQNNYVDIASTLTGTTPEVSDYTIYGLNETYSGLKGWDITVGVNNLFNTAPPYSNVGGQIPFQAGYNPSYVDPRDRFFYLDVKWKIK